MTSEPDWGEQARRLAETLRAVVGEVPADGAGECRWCPHCQLAAVVRGERPEVTAALADVLASATVALRAFAAAVPEPGRGTPPDAGGGAGSGARPETGEGDPGRSTEPDPGPRGDDEEPAPEPIPAPAVQRIEIV